MKRSHSSWQQGSIAPGKALKKMPLCIKILNNIGIIKLIIYYRASNHEMIFTSRNDAIWPSSEMQNTEVVHHLSISLIHSDSVIGFAINLPSTQRLSRFQSLSLKSLYTRLAAHQRTYPVCLLYQTQLLLKRKSLHRHCLLGQ